MSNRRRLMVILTSSLLIVTTGISFITVVFFCRSLIFNIYKIEFLAQIALIVFLPLLTFCISLLGLILISNDYSPSRRKR